jgi:hypothetical protein
MTPLMRQLWAAALPPQTNTVAFLVEPVKASTSIGEKMWCEMGANPPSFLYLFIDTLSLFVGSKPTLFPF